MPLADLRNRLFVRLGRYDPLKTTGRAPFTVFKATEFACDEDLEDAFMSAAYVPLGTSVMPPGFQGAVAYDAALIDGVTGERGFRADVENLWPPMSSCAPDVEPSKVCVIPQKGTVQAEIDPKGMRVVQGRFRPLMDFWAAPSTMREGFIEGYAEALSQINVDSGDEAARLAAGAKLVDQIMAAQAQWKKERGFCTPKILLPYDSLFAVMPVVAGVVALAAWSATSAIM